MEDSMLLSLPPELRIPIYEYALHFDSILQRPLRAPPPHRETPSHRPANLSLLCVSKSIHEEAKDVFHEFNRFRVSYNHMCYCQNKYPYPAFHERVGELEVINFMPRVDEPETCRYCEDAGYGLLRCLGNLPKLRNVSIAFEDIFSFTDFTPAVFARLAKEHKTELASDEIGLITVAGLSSRLSISLPALHYAWAILAYSNGSRAGREHPRLPGEGTMRRALEYLQFEANTYDRTATALLPFFIPSNGATGGDAGGTRSLRFQGLPDGRRRRAEFTVALVGVLNDIFADDGGSDSVDWADIEGSGTWTFRVDVYA